MRLARGLSRGRLNVWERKSKGESIAGILRESWRRSPSPLKVSPDDLARLAPLLLKSGTASLCWRRIRISGWRNTLLSREFLQLYHYQILQARISQSKIEEVIRLLRSVQVEPILVKGWAIARLYPEQGLRPYCDIDLCVREEQFTTAQTALRPLAGSRFSIDLHKGFTKLGGGSVDRLYTRSKLVRLGETDVRVLSPEDHLRVLCFHMLREGAWRPLWLCDIAVALECRPARFDWEHCFDGTKRSRELVSCAIGLAYQLVGAQVDGIPYTASIKNLPNWAVPTVLKEWGSPNPYMTRRHRMPLATDWHSPSIILEGLRSRWPNAVEATIVVNGPFNNLPRLPFQLGSYLARAISFLQQRLKLE